MKKKLKPGDVLEIIISDNRNGYLLYLTKHLEYGDCLFVAPETFDRRPEDFGVVFQNGYTIFYPATLALSRKLVELVGQTEIPPGLPPERFRRAGARSGTKIESWVFENKSGDESVKTKLSDEEKLIPIASIWNHEFLLHRIADQWRPELEG